MALVKATFKTKIKTLMNALKSEENQEAAIDKFAGDLADAVDSYIKSATITSTHVAVLSSPAGPVTGTITTTNSIS